MEARPRHHASRPAALERIDELIPPGRSLPGASALLLFVLAAWLAVASGCSFRSFRPDRRSPQEVILERKREGIESLIASARGGSLVPFDEALVVVDEALVQDLLAATIPFEREIGHGVVVRVLGATVSFQDGLALVRLDGTARLASVANITAELVVYGELTMMELDAPLGVLRGRVRVIAVEERAVKVFGLRPSLTRLLEDLEDLGVESYDELDITIEIPVRLAGRVNLPEVGPYGDFRIPAASIPLELALGSVRSLRGKLWISVKVVVPQTRDPS